MHPSRRLEEDDAGVHAVAWATFAISVGVLLAFDVACLHSSLSAGLMSFQTAVKLTLFWFSMGLLFDVFVLSYLGWDASLGFLQGFFLEYMLSFDNLFVFHLVFAYYCTPEALLYRALYFGIAGAIVLRVIFLLVGFTFLNSGLYIVKFIFGAMLIWSGIRSANDLDDEDTGNPTNNPFLSWVTKNLPVSDSYEPNGHFFVTVAEVECLPSRAVNATSALEVVNEEHAEVEVRTQHQQGQLEQVAGALPRLESFEGSSLLGPGAGGSGAGSLASGQGAQWPLRQASDSFEVMRRPARLRRKASLLFLVVIAVWVVDLVFAVDSVASKLAAVRDVFLNCSSSAFAMLSLRSLYFVMESLTRTFQMLKYGIAAILIVIGLKLLLAGWLDISDGAGFMVTVGIVAASMASSYWMPRIREDCERVDLEGANSPVEEDAGGGIFERRPQLEVSD